MREYRATPESFCGSLAAVLTATAMLTGVDRVSGRAVWDENGDRKPGEAVEGEGSD
jgi:hypothetical protein